MSGSIYERYPRCLLLSGQPIFLGTAEAESVTSYFQRVAQSNGLTLGELMWGTVIGEYAKSNADLIALRRIGSSSLARGTVCVSEQGLQFTEALARLTGRGAVRWMNWSASTEGLSLARLMRSHLAWCPHCLKDDEQPYFRALWDMALVNSCVRHKCRLLHKCSHCGAPQRRYRPKGSLLLCQKCEQPLTSNQTMQTTPGDAEISRELGELIAEISGGRLRLSAKNMKAALFRWAEGQGADSVKKQERLLGVSRSLVSYWRNSDLEASIQRLLELCLHLGLPVLEVCRGNLCITASPILGRKIQKAWRFYKLTAEKKEDLKNQLSEFASNPFPPFLQQIATKSGVSRKTLEAIDPQSCAKLTRGANDQLKIVSAVRFIRFRGEVDRYMMKADQLGQIPTVAQVGQNLRHPGIMRSPKCREYVGAMIAKLERQHSINSGKL